jgi:hypothetical protein
MVIKKLLYVFKNSRGKDNGSNNEKNKEFK